MFSFTKLKQILKLLLLRNVSTSEKQLLSQRFWTQTSAATHDDQEQECVEQKLKPVGYSRNCLEHLPEDHFIHALIQRKNF